MGLVHYPTVFSGLEADIKCADNAHSNSSNMRVLYESSGIWSDYNTPKCHCNEGYRILSITGDGSLCEG